MILDITLSILVGFMAHFTRPQIQKISTVGWREITGHVEGSVLVTLLGYRIYCNHFKDLKNGKRYIVTQALALLGFGLGNAFAWFVNGE
jgi:hypothetical protein